MASKDRLQTGASAARCPICKEPTEPGYKPFCSARCRDVDLSRWLSGAYAIPGGGAAADEDGEDRAARNAQSQPAGEDEEKP